MRVVLFGPPCGGKTWIAKHYANYFDLDEAIAERTGRTPREIPEKEFRALEKEMLHTIGDQQVIAVGGGTVLDPENAAFLKKLGLMVLVLPSEETLRARLTKMGREYLIPELAKRKGTYEALADIIVDPTQWEA